MAPFWADVDTRRNGGQVFYRQTLDPGLLQQATDAVKASYVNHRKFTATWLLIATWYEVCFFGSYGPNKSKVGREVLYKKYSGLTLKTFHICFGFLSIVNRNIASLLPVVSFFLKLFYLIFVYIPSEKK